MPYSWNVSKYESKRNIYLFSKGHNIKQVALVTYRLIDSQFFRKLAVSVNVKSATYLVRLRCWVLENNRKCNTYRICHEQPALSKQWTSILMWNTVPDQRRRTYQSNVYNSSSNTKYGSKTNYQLQVIPTILPTSCKAHQYFIQSIILAKPLLRWSWLPYCYGLLTVLVS